MIRVLITLILIASSASAQRRSLSAKELTGTYVHDLGDDWHVNQVRVKSLGKNKLWVYFNFVRVLSVGDANLGWIGGYATIRGDSATFDEPVERWDGRKPTPTCTIGLKFIKPGVLIVSDEVYGWDSCSFGYRVTGAGRYKKVSNRLPK